MTEPTRRPGQSDMRRDPETFFRKMADGTLTDAELDEAMTAPVWLQAGRGKAHAIAWDEPHESFDVEGVIYQFQRALCGRVVCTSEAVLGNELQACGKCVAGFERERARASAEDRGAVRPYAFETFFPKVVDGTLTDAEIDAILTDAELEAMTAPVWMRACRGKAHAIAWDEPHGIAWDEPHERNVVQRALCGHVICTADALRVRGKELPACGNCVAGLGRERARGAARFAEYLHAARQLRERDLRASGAPGSRALALKPGAVDGAK